MTSTRPQSTPTCSSWSRHRSSPTKSLLRTPTTMTLHSKTCSTKHIERKSITLYEKTCLSVCRRRQCPIEQGDLLEIDRGDPVSIEAQKHRLGLCSTSKKSEFLQSTKQELINTNFKQLEPKKMNNFFKDNYCRKKLEFREAYQRSLTEMEELRKFQSSAFNTMARRKLVEDQNTILELSGRVQELQNEVNCMCDSKEFQDDESVRSGNSHVTSRPVSFPPHPIPEGMLRHSFVTPSCREGPPSIWDTHGTSGNVFLQIQMRHHQHLITNNNCINRNHRSKSRSIHPQWRKVKGMNKIKI